MTNDKDLFSQINDLFEDVTVDQASDLIGEKLTPKQSDYEKELIEKLNNNDFTLDDKLVEEITNNIEKGGEVDRTLTQYLREKFGLAEPQAGQEYIVEEVLEQPQTEEEEPAVREDYIAQYADSLSSVIKKSEASQLRDRWAQTDDPQQRGDIYEKVDALTVQLNMLRSSLTEATMVSGIGQGGDGQSPGSGEVRINRMDDVNLGPDGIGGLNPGDVLVWDPDCNKGEGCWVPKPGEELGTDTSPVFGAVWSCLELKEEGTLYWGTNADYINGVTTNPVKVGVKKIDYALSIDYTDNENGTYTGVWIAFGAQDLAGSPIKPAPSVGSGTSGINGPEGFYLLGADCATDDGTEDGETLTGTIFGCKEFDEADGGDLYWGTSDDQELGAAGSGVEISTPGKITKIIGSLSSNADPVTRVGDWTCIYEYAAADGSIQQGTSTVTNQRDGVDYNGFFVLNGTCLEPPIPPIGERPVLGFISGCGETSDEEAPIKWGNSFQAANGTGDSVTSPDTMAKRIIAVVAKGVDTSRFGTWTCIYEDKNRDIQTVEYEGTSSLVGPDGFYLDTANCASDEPDAPSESAPAFGQITGCKLVNLGGNLTWGTNAEYLADGGTVVAAEAKKLWAVFSTNADATTNVGTWNALYQDINDEWKVAVSPENDKASPEYGFFIKGDTCDEDGTGDDGRPEGFKFGYISGCKELVTPDGPLHWGTTAEYEAGTGADLGLRASKILFSFSVDSDDLNTGNWNCLYRNDSAALTITTQAGQSPDYGFFIAGNDCKSGSNPEGEMNGILGETFGCVRVVPKGKLYWGTQDDLDNSTGTLIDEDVTQIIGIIGENVYDNLFGEWRCVYKKGSTTFPALVSEVNVGTNPTESYYLVEDPGGSCVEDGLEFPQVDGNEPNFGLIIGCPESTVGSESDLYWADSRDAIANGNGVQLTTTKDVHKIISVLSFDEAATDGTRAWTCLYQLFNGDYGFAEYTGTTPPGGFYLETDSCAGDDSVDIPGNGLVDFIKFGRPVGCDENDASDPGSLYWSNIIATQGGENGVLVDADDVTKLKFSFTLDKQYRSWNLFYEKTAGTAFVKYPSILTGETYRSWPWGFHIVDGTCLDSGTVPEPPDNIGDGKPTFGIITGCKKTEESGGSSLYWGTAEDAAAEDESGAYGKKLSDINGVPINDAVRIISVISFNADQFRFGTWICVYKNDNKEIKIATANGRSPLQGFYLHGNVCDGDGGGPGDGGPGGGECDDTNDCPDGLVCVGGTCVLLPCDPDATPPCPDGMECMFGFCYKPCDPTLPEPCPEGFECVEINGINLCVPGGEFPGGGGGSDCSVTNDCPDGFICVDGNCVQKPCDIDGACEGDEICFGGFCYKPCVPGVECPNGFSCVDLGGGISICVPGLWPPGGELPEPPGGGDCSGGEPCPPGFTCYNGVCVLLPCDDDSDCDNNSECIFGHCYQRCDNGGSCPEGFNCIEVNGISICVPGFELPGGGIFPIEPGGGSCDDTIDCPPGFTCVGGICVLLPCPGGDCTSLGNFECIGGHCFPTCDNVTYPETGCPPGYICTTVNGNDICLPGGELPGGGGAGGGTCPDDFECAPGYECDGGECVPIECDINGECPSLIDGHCYGGHCYEKCDTTLPKPCPPGFICVTLDDGQSVCMPIGGGNIGCREDVECDYGYECVDGFCRPLPTPPDGTCPDGGISFEDYCYQGCADGDCPPGYTCIVTPNGPACLPIGGGGNNNCSEDNDCEEGYECVDGHCVPKKCTENSDCPSGYKCHEGTCFPLCGPDGIDCPPGHICVSIGGGDTVCMPDGHGQNGCHKDTDCDPGFECVDGECVPIRCDGTCEGDLDCYEGICYEKCNDGICPPGFQCVVPDGGQPICMPIGGGGEGGNELDDIYLGYFPGCRVAERGPVTLYYGLGESTSTDVVKDTNALGIITSFATADDYDAATGEGNWTCIYTNVTNEIKTKSERGVSPLEGFYVKDLSDDTNCKDSNPDQPGGNPDRIDTDPIGCIQSNPGSLLKWGSESDVVDGTGTDIVDTDVVEIVYTGSENNYPNGFGDQIVVYKKDNGLLKQATIYRQTPINDVDYGFFLDVVASGTECTKSGNEHGPELGLITGCREVSDDGTVYWGTRADYSNLTADIDDVISTPAKNLGVKAKIILAVVSVDADENGVGNWKIHYRTKAGVTDTVVYYGKSGPAGPEGAFILPSEGSVCLTDGSETLRKIYTDEVILRAVDDLKQDTDTLRSLKGGKPYPYFEHQDSANAFFSDEILDLNRKKPTMLVERFTGTETSDPDYTLPGIPQGYLPMTGDLWLDPNADSEGRENVLRAAIVDRTNLDLSAPDIEDVTVDWVVVSGDGEGGGGGGANTTDEVYLINTVQFYEKYNKVLNITFDEFVQFFPLVTQEDVNLLNRDMLALLYDKKPTIHVTNEIYGVGRYLPQQGDLWIDPTDYTMYVCDVSHPELGQPNPILNPGDGFPYQDGDGNYFYWVEVGGAGGGSGNRVYIQIDPPEFAVKGDLWVDQADYLFYVFTPEGTWAALTGDQSAMGKKFEVSIGSVPPLNPERGSLWFDTEDSEMRIWIRDIGGNNWLPVSNGGFDRRKVMYEKSLFELNQQYQELNSRLKELEGTSSDPISNNFTYPQEVTIVDEQGPIGEY